MRRENPGGEGRLERAEDGRDALGVDVEEDDGLGKVGVREVADHAEKSVGGGRLLGLLGVELG